MVQPSRPEPLIFLFQNGRCVLHYAIEMQDARLVQRLIVAGAEDIAWVRLCTAYETHAREACTLGRSDGNDDNNLN